MTVDKSANICICIWQKYGDRSVSYHEVSMDWNFRAYMAILAPAEQLETGGSHHPVPVMQSIRWAKTETRQLTDTQLHTLLNALQALHRLTAAPEVQLFSEYSSQPAAVQMNAMQTFC